MWSGAKELTVLSFNVQYMAGKSYVFYYDQGKGRDKRPSVDQVLWSLDRVAAVIKEVDPDVVMLQELNDADDGRTHFIDQLSELQRRLGNSAYPCDSSAYYWKAGLVPHPMIMGPVSMKLVTLSRYALEGGRRYQLPRMENDPVTRHFYFQRAIHEVRLKSATGAQELALLNTHFDAWGHGSDLMDRQVAAALSITERLDAQAVPWILAGDFNLLPPDGGLQWQRLRQYYDSVSALQPLYQRYSGVPSIESLTGPEAASWFTHFPNDPQVSGPDRTIDYLFYSPQLSLIQAYVRQRDTLNISDHLPLVGVFALTDQAEPKENPLLH